MARFLIDFDSTLSDLTSNQLKYANTKFGTNYSRSDIIDWNWNSYMPAEICDYVWGPEIFMNPGFHLTSSSMQGAIKGMKILINRGNDLFIISDRPEALYDSTRAWLDKRGLKKVPLIFTNSKTYPKIDRIRELELTHVVEDSPHHAETMAEEPSVEKVYLLLQPYNKHIEGEKIIPVKNWRHIIHKESLILA